MIEAKFIDNDEQKDALEVLRQIDEIEVFNNDQKDSYYQVVVYDESKPIATGTLILDSKPRIENIAVISKCRKTYIGDLVVKMLLDKAFQLQCEKVIVYSPKHITGFFKKIGFKGEDEQLDELEVLSIKKEDIKKCSH